MISALCLLSAYFTSEKLTTRTTTTYLWRKSLDCLSSFVQEFILCLRPLASSRLCSMYRLQTEYAYVYDKWVTNLISQFSSKIVLISLLFCSWRNSEFDVDRYATNDGRDQSNQHHLDRSINHFAITLLFMGLLRTFLLGRFGSDDFTHSNQCHPFQQNEKVPNL